MTFWIFDFRFGLKAGEQTGECSFFEEMSGSVSDNRKSAIQNPKWLGLSVIAFVLVAAVAVAQAQQPGKVFRLGFL